MKRTLNHLLPGKHQKPILIDVFYKPSKQPKPVVIFCHGYKGFKDWGAWKLMAESFANEGFLFIKFNFSHNGGTVEHPIDFPDLEAFGNNNYTKELDDLETVLDWITTTADFLKEIDINNIALIGHSRAGGIVTIKAEEDSRVSKIITLAGVCDFKKRTATTGHLDIWKKDGVKYVLNGRTKQQMPHYYQFYEDFIENEERLTIQRAVQSLKVPMLIIHGNSDNSVFIKEAENLHKWNAKSQLEIINDANHVFNTKHPWLQEQMSEALESVVEKSINFLK